MTENPDEKSLRERIIPFFDYLGRHIEDRGMMADLRHGFSQTTGYRAWPHIACWCQNFQNARERKVMLTVAGGFAFHLKSVPGGNMGTVLRRIASGDAQGTEGLATFDGRFRRLLACSSPIELCDLLVSVLRAAERKGIPVDFAQLYEDLMYWGEKKKVAWAGEFWTSGHNTSESSPPEEDDE